MLSTYKKTHYKATIQYLVIDVHGAILESDDVLFTKVINKNITEIHPFFEGFIPLLTIPDQTYEFLCINIKYNSDELKVDIILKTFKDKPALIIIENLTDHYLDYRLTVQARNEFFIKSQFIELKNKYLQDQEKFKNTFIATFSHELRDPLTGIATFTDILNKTHLSERERDYLDTINLSSNYLSNMIDDILDISKIEVGNLKISKEPFNLKGLLEDLAFSYNIKAEEQGLDFIYDFNERIPEFVLGDDLRLKQTLSNLLDNAFQFTPSGSVRFNVSVNQLRALNASIRFEVIDTGIGIKEEDFKIIFDSFSKLNDDTLHDGSGLGLSFVKHLVSLMNGKIFLESELGKGSTFVATINFKIVLHHKGIRKNIVNFSKPSSSKKFNILLVEDSEIAQLSVLKILVTQGDFFLDIVSKAEDIIPRLLNQKFDLVLMDIKIDGAQGDLVAKEIRKLPLKEYRNIPIIAITAKLFEEDLKRYKQAGMNAVIRKPFNETSLLKSIYKHLKTDD